MVKLYCSKCNKDIKVKNPFDYIAPNKSLTCPNCKTKWQVEMKYGQNYNPFFYIINKWNKKNKN